jgi:hypothetical protein
LLAQGVKEETTNDGKNAFVLGGNGFFVGERIVPRSVSEQGTGT